MPLPETGLIPFKIYPELEGHSVLIVHSERVRREWADILRNMQKMQTLVPEELPDDLVSYIEDNGIEAVIIHPSTMQDIDALTQAFSAGTKVVVVQKSGDVGPHFFEINQRALDNGLSSVSLLYNTNIGNVVALLANQFVSK